MDREWQLRAKVWTDWYDELVQHDVPIAGVNRAIAEMQHADDGHTLTIIRAVCRRVR